MMMIMAMVVVMMMMMIDDDDNDVGDDDDDEDDDDDNGDYDTEKADQISQQFFSHVRIISWVDLEPVHLSTEDKVSNCSDTDSALHL